MTRTQHLLIILMEECDEVSQRASKALRFGISEVQPQQPFTNADRLMFEMAHLVAAYEMLLAEYPGKLLQVDRPAIYQKKEKVEAFLRYSAECGQLTP